MTEQSRQKDKQHDSIEISNQLPKSSLLVINFILCLQTWVKQAPRNMKEPIKRRSLHFTTCSEYRRLPHRHPSPTRQIDTAFSGPPDIQASALSFEETDLLEPRFPRARVAADSARMAELMEVGISIAPFAMTMFNPNSKGRAQPSMSMMLYRKCTVLLGGNSGRASPRSLTIQSL